MEWPSGEATACKAVHTGSIPVSTSIKTRAISSAGERFPDTEEVTGSIPVSRTKVFLQVKRLHKRPSHALPYWPFNRQLKRSRRTWQIAVHVGDQM